MVYIAIDIGSTYIKSSLLDPVTGEIKERNRAAVTQKLRQDSPLRFEIEMSGIMNSVKAILDGYTARRSDIKGILLSTQQHGFVYSRMRAALSRSMKAERRCFPCCRG